MSLPGSKNPLRLEFRSGRQESTCGESPQEWSKRCVGDLEDFWLPVRVPSMLGCPPGDRGQGFQCLLAWP